MMTSSEGSSTGTMTRERLPVLASRGIVKDAPKTPALIHTRKVLPALILLEGISEGMRKLKWRRLSKGWRTKRKKN